MNAVWDEWEGNGFDDAVAFALGTWSDVASAWKSIKQLGVDIPHDTSLELVEGFVGTVGGDIVYDACTAGGITLADDEVYVDPDSVLAATFAVFVDWD